jgi:hypothetical protein
MSPIKRHIKSQNNITYEESYALCEPTTATFISTEIMETNAEKERVRQESEVVQTERKLVKNKETKG